MIKIFTNFYLRFSLAECSIWIFNISVLILWYPQEALQDEIKALEGRVSSIQGVLGDLKIQLYAKFGNNINLEAEESWNLKHVDLISQTLSLQQDMTFLRFSFHPVYSTDVCCISHVVMFSVLSELLHAGGFEAG